MHRFATVTASTLLFVSTLACTGDLLSSAPPTPKYDRSEIRGGRAPVPFKTMKDLPYYGGGIEKASKGYMQVVYMPDIATAEQLAEWWPAAVEAEGWTRTSGGNNPDGGFSATYDLPGGSDALLSVDPQGTLWLVNLSVTEAPTD